MARFTNKATKVVVTVDDSKAHRFPADVWDADKDNLAAPATTGYGSLKVAELREEIDRRNEDRDEDDQLSTEGNKADLIATLEADDAE